MRNYFSLIVLLGCLALVGCKKDIHPKENDPQVSLNFDGNRDMYYGKLTGQFRGVELIRVPSTDRSNWNQYSLRAGKNEQNHVIVLFNGPAPLTKENLDQIEYGGIYYVMNGEVVTYSNLEGVVHIEMESNNTIGGSFYGIHMPIQDPERRVLVGHFKKVLQR